MAHSPCGSKPRRGPPSGKAFRDGTSAHEIASLPTPSALSSRHAHQQRLIVVDAQGSVTSSIVLARHSGSDTLQREADPIGDVVFDGVHAWPIPAIEVDLFDA